MIWLTWRQHRTAALAIALLLGVVAVFLVVTGLPMYRAFEADGVGACVGRTTASCVEVLTRFSDAYRGTGTQLIPWLNFIPLLLGVFVGAPLMARELEQRTHQLVWTQGVSRRRWLAVKVASLLALTVAAALVFTALMTWWRWPLDQLEGHFAPNVFDFEGPVVTAYAVCAFALGTAAGVVLRQTVVAMAVTLGGFLALRLSVESWLRPHYLPPLTATSDPTGTRPDVLNGIGNWAFEGGFVDHSGHRLSDSETNAVFRAAIDSGANPFTYLHEHGILRWVDYQPADRLATFQTIETAIFAALALALLGLAVAWMRWRTA